MTDSVLIKITFILHARCYLCALLIFCQPIATDADETPLLMAVRHSELGYNVRKY
jgi:hypothetical protein